MKDKSVSTNPSTVKSRRRYLVADAVARRILLQGDATWSSVTTTFTGALLPLNVNPDDLTEAEVRKTIRAILNSFIDNLDALPPIKSTSKKADDLQGILASVPRRKRGKK